MSARVSLQARVEQYLAERRRLGFELDNMGHRLASFARYVASADHHGPLTVDLMAGWARQAKARSPRRARTTGASALSPQKPQPLPIRTRLVMMRPRVCPEVSYRLGGHRQPTHSPIPFLRPGLV